MRAQVIDLPSIQIVPLAPDGWVVRGEDGREIGHFASQAEAEAVGQALARKRKVDLIINPAGGGIPIRERPNVRFRRRFDR
jgi:hypothetical protein